MNDFDGLKLICERNVKLSDAVIDNFVMYYGATKDDLARETDSRLKAFRHLTSQFQPSLVNLLTSQYIVYRIFKQDGIIRKYINDADIKRRPAEEQTFLQHQLANPWRFSFSIVLNTPYPNFYNMEDAFTGERFLLYSKSVTVTLEDTPVLLWFNLIWFNGACWQTFGPITGYQSFDDDDIFFFATELNSKIDSDESLLEDVERNPVPYMMLINGSRFPLTMSNDDELVQVFAEHDVELLSKMEEFNSDFTREYNEGVYKLALNGWDQPPHFALAYYDEMQNTLTLHAMTDRGFNKLVEKFNERGLHIPLGPHLRVHPSMLVTAERLLRREIRIPSSEDLFVKKTSAGNREMIDRLNALMAKVLPEINSGKKPNLEKLSEEFNLDYQSVKEMVSSAIERIELLKRKIK